MLSPKPKGYGDGRERQNHSAAGRLPLVARGHPPGAPRRGRAARSVPRSPRRRDRAGRAAPTPGRTDRSGGEPASSSTGMGVVIAAFAIGLLTGAAGLLAAAWLSVS